MPADAIERAYDEVLYPADPILETHPAHLSTIATLCGMRPAPASRCRVLELGCGAGGNLMAMAYQYPESRFVGIDLSSRSIEIGNRNLAEIGLTNLALHHADITQVTGELGQFDYVFAHGVYSWVPGAVREHMMALYKAHLAPQGVGYVSYNAYPGAHLRDVARDLVLFRTRGIEEPRAAIQAANAVLKSAAENAPDGDLHGYIMRDQYRRIRRDLEEAFYHDDLSPIATPFLLHEVAQAAASHGLQYLGDASFGHARFSSLSVAALARVEQIPEERAVERDQLVDFIVGRAFHRTLLCHDDVVLTRGIGPDSIRSLFCSGRFSVSDESLAPLAPGIVALRTADGSTLETDHPIAKASLLHLGAIWPQSVRFTDLLERALVQVRHAGVTVEGVADDHAETLATILLRAFASRQVELHVEPFPLTTAAGERPEASLFARKFAEGGTVTNLRHRRVGLNDGTTRRFLALVDGTRTADDLVRDLNDDLKRTSASAPVQVTRQQVDGSLAMLARLALLVR